MVSAIIVTDHFRTEITVGGKMVIADEPEELDGTNQGPAPGEFLLISLASCTAITLRMYADRKNWPIEKIIVEVNFEKVDNKTIFKRELQLVGDLTDEQKARLLQIANACPVHKTLTNPIEIQTSLS
ncbi:MAG: OsmC family protein [Cytophagales bacterium]|nr:OsmC family protein [Cytophagales bacterium]MCA6366597.1 OsmC family protein [Cytophagales bacterium]MCA6370008.1 OsmC family protein [Cytophagales bacterium]MCA6375188.1 OsmC family protein [Cytophagales bacterium]MCA6384244.1 OsmC family protein [Cytophagales bacterium]